MRTACLGCMHNFSILEALQDCFLLIGRTGVCSMHNMHSIQGRLHYEGEARIVTGVILGIHMTCPSVFFVAEDSAII